VKSLMTPEKLQVRMGAAAKARELRRFYWLKRVEELTRRVLFERQHQGLEYRAQAACIYSAELWAEANVITDALRDVGEYECAEDIQNALSQGGVI
jgi:hypothetical protein